MTLGQDIPSTGKQDSMRQTEEAQFGPYGHAIEKQSVTYQRGFEPAIRETVDAQIESIRQHVEDLVKLSSAELRGQIDLLRRDINDLRDREQQRRQQGWDLRKLMINGLILLAAAAGGALITWVLTHAGT